jgi:uncharacterized protein (TIGR03067 family)
VRHVVKTKALLILSVFLCIAAAPPRIDEAKRELSRMQGTWTMEALEVNGEEVPAKKLMGTTLTIKGDKYVVKVKDNSYETTIKLDPSKDPKHIDTYFPNGTELPKLSKGVYELDGDTLKICRHQTPGEDRPAQIGSWANTNLFVVTWKRKKE